MVISPHTAKQIVKEIDQIIGQKVNFIDGTGYILASSDEGRVGDFHAGAEQVIKNKLDFLLIDAEDEYEGSKKGINLPITLEEEIVGVIGITGEKEDVEKLGQVIKKMTEILISEDYNKQKKKSEERIKARFIEEWLMQDGMSRREALIEKGTYLGYNMHILRRVIIIECYDVLFETDTDKIQSSIESMNRALKRIVESRKDCIFTKTNSQSYCIIPRCSDDAVRILAEQLVDEVERQCGIAICAGIDSLHAKSLHMSYLQAQKALTASKRRYKEKVRLYTDLTLELFLDEISISSKIEYLKKIFYGYSFAGMEPEIEFLERYYQQEGSIARTAQALFIHPNTLQYKLKKIYEKTGYDPRSLQDSSYFIMAISMFRDSREQLMEIEE